MEVFLYGLFMDESILKKKGVHPSNPRIGYLNDYALKIGERASLIPCKNERTYGVIMTVNEDAIHRLYNEPSVADYIPEEVSVIIDSNELVTATCYNLPVDQITGINKAYAQKLYELVKTKGFPTDYLKMISKMTTS